MKAPFLRQQLSNGRSQTKLRFVPFAFIFVCKIGSELIGTCYSGLTGGQSSGLNRHSP